MPQQTPNRFTTYDFTEEELKSAEVLNPLQKMRIQSEVGRIAQQILNLDCANKNDIPDFEVQRAFLKGQMTSLEFILELSTSRELNIVTEDAAHDYTLTPAGPNLYTTVFQQSAEDSNSSDSNQSTPNPFSGE
jgi:hypothetical protein